MSSKLTTGSSNNNIYLVYASFATDTVTITAQPTGMSHLSEKVSDDVTSFMP